MELSGIELIQFQSLIDWAEEFYSLPGVEVRIERAEMTAQVVHIDPRQLVHHLESTWPHLEAEAYGNYFSDEVKVSLRESTAKAQSFAEDIVRHQPVKRPHTPPGDISVFAVARSSMQAAAWRNGHVTVTSALVDHTNIATACALALYHFDLVVQNTGLSPDEVAHAMAHAARFIATGRPMPVDHILSLNRVTDCIASHYPGEMFEIVIRGVSAMLFHFILAHEFAHITAGHHHGHLLLHSDVVITSKSQERSFQEYEADALAVLTCTNIIHSAGHRLNPHITFLTILAAAMLQLPQRRLSAKTGKELDISEHGYFDTYSRTVLLMEHFFTESWLSDERFLPYINVLAHLRLFQQISTEIWTPTK